MTDTIAAISTAPYESAIGVVRLSGPESFAVAEKLFSPAAGGSIRDCPRRKMVYGAIKNSAGETVDYGMCALFSAPASFTGEDSAELYGHGSPAALGSILAAACSLGARPAEAGEFTRRAFLNGKLDLSEAEAVADLISAKSERAAVASANQLGGELSRRVEEIYASLAGLCAHFQAVADYPDEDIEPFELPALAAAIGKEGEKAEALIRAYDRGKFIKDGIPCAIIGRPNAGKSSILNALVGYSRAIVTDIPGTTRDTIEETILLSGRLFRLTDTAGLRQTGDRAEIFGVERAVEAAKRAEIVIFVLDGSESFGNEDAGLLESAREICSDGKRLLVVLNKSDLGISCELPAPKEGETAVCLSALTGEGLDRLTGAIVKAAGGSGDRGGEVFLSNARQLGAVTRARAALTRAEEALSGGMTPDAVLFDIEDAMGALAEITGRSVTADIIDNIFSRFCVGK